MGKVKTLDELTLKDVVDTLVTYDIEHCKFPHNYLAQQFQEYEEKDLFEMNGLADDTKKLILLNKELPTEQMREVVIHELLHTKHYRLGDLKVGNVEKTIQRETEKTYKNLYGVTPS